MYLPDWATNAHQINKAQEIYLKVYRSRLLESCRGSWVACSSLGEIVMTPTQESTLDLARKYFQPKDRSVDYFMACMGSEFSVFASVDDLAVIDSFNSASEGSKNGIQDNGLYIHGEFSVDGGKIYTTYQMKHDTGAAVMGVPSAVLSQYSLNRSPDVMILRGPNDIPFRANIYQNLFYRIEGLVTKTDVVQLSGDRFLIGQPVYLRYRNIVDKSADKVLTMVPLEGEINHEPL